VRRALLAAALALASGCATVNGDPRDPLEGLNRATYGFNEGFDSAIAKPVAMAYKDALPDPVRTWVRNFFGNIADIFIGLNNFLQGKPDEALSDWVRVALNTTVGILGINDVASDMGYEKHNEDFGQTFGRYGVGDGFYLVLPFLGPSTARDTVGTVLDAWIDPVRRHKPTAARNFLVLLRATGLRADLLDASRILEEAALDKYVFQRDAYLQRRRNLIHDGNPPREGRAPRPERIGGPGPDPAPVEQPSPRLAAAPATSLEAAGERMPPAQRVHETGRGRRVLGIYEPRVPKNYAAVIAAAATDAR
jgi:phospholipid-binding lipoprotein MlaA